MFSILKNRGVIKISGKDAKPFLQGLITNDINNIGEDKFLYAMMLSPQGRFLYDFFIIKQGDDILLDCPKISMGEITKKFQMYKLRSEVEIMETDLLVYASLTPKVGFFPDPRNFKMGYRSVSMHEGHGDFIEYEKLRIENVIPDADKDFIFNRSLPLEYGANQLNAIDYKKGCYVGQEVTARTNYRATIRKKLYKFTAVESLPKEEEIKVGEYKIGIILGMEGGEGLCLLNVEEYEKFAADKAEFYVNGINVKILS